MKRRGGEIVVNSLLNHGVRTVYGIPGVSILNIYDSLRGTSNIQHLLVMHEVNAAFMADAHGRLTGKPGVCLVIAGPGATNAITGIAQAYSEASPVIQITGHSSTTDKIQPYHGVNDWNFLLKMYQPITKWCVRIESVEDISSIIDKAFTVASSDRPGPVHVEIPVDVLEGSKEINEFKVHTVSRSFDNMSSVLQVADALASAISPLIVVGRGVLREFCSDEVMQLAKRLGAPILTLSSAISAIPYQYPLYVGYDLEKRMYPYFKSLIKKADVIVTLGFDLGERLTIFKEHNGKVIHIFHDTAESELSQRAKSTMNVMTGLKIFLIELVSEIKKKGITSYETEILEKNIFNIKKKICDDVHKSIRLGSSPIHPGEVGVELRRILTDRAIITMDIGNYTTWMKICCRPHVSNTMLTPGRFGSMGFALPAAIAAKINFPERQVVAVTGDGGFLMSYMDFSTIVKYKLGIIVVVINNRHYGMIWQIQRAKYSGRTFATEIEVSDFSKYAQVFGATGIKIRTSEELRKGLVEAVNITGSVLVDIETNHKFPSYLPSSTRRFLRTMKYLGR